MAKKSRSERPSGLAKADSQQKKQDNKVRHSSLGNPGQAAVVQVQVVQNAA